MGYSISQVTIGRIEMSKKIYAAVLLLVLVFVSVPVFAGVSVDLGGSLLGNVVWSATRPLGGTVGVGITLFDYKAVVQVSGTFMSPPLGDTYEDPAGVLSAGILFSPLQYFFLGMRTTMVTPPDTVDDFTTFGTLVLRIQNSGKGMHFFAETEISPSGLLNKFTAGLNMMF